MKKIVLTIALGVSLVAAQSQVRIIEEEKVSRLMQEYLAKNSVEEEAEGWRVQFLYTDDRRQMEQTIEKIEKDFPSMQVTWKQKKPYYFIVGGAFEKELEALRFIYKIREEYPSALVVRETIQKTEIRESINRR